MYKGKKIAALIPARGGSKGLPGKNIRPLLGKPLICWTIEQALSSKYLDRVIVSTDDKAIAGISKRAGAEVPFMRPRRLASDKAKSIDAIIHAVEFLRGNGSEFDYLMLLEPASPLREVSDIDNAVKLLIDNKVKASSIVSVSKVEAAHPAFDVMINKKGFIIPYGSGGMKAKRRQDITELYFFEGTIYMSEIKELFRRKGFYHNRTIAYVVPKWKAPEIDDISDLIYAEAILKNIARIKRECR